VIVKKDERIEGLILRRRRHVAFRCQVA
jgi:hypothetical protein